MSYAGLRQLRNGLLLMKFAVISVESEMFGLNWSWDLDYGYELMFTWAPEAVSSSTGVRGVGHSSSINSPCTLECHPGDST